MKERVQSFLLLLYLFIYVFSNLIAGEGSLLLVTLVKVGILGLFFIISFRLKGNSSLIRYRGTMILLFLFVLLQIVIIDNTNSIKILGINLIVFMCFANWSNPQLLNVLMVSMKFCAVVSCLSVVYLAIIFGEVAYLRDEAIIDKSFMTTFLSMTFIFSLSDIFYNRHKKVNLFLLLFILSIDIILIQSKISLLVFLIVFLCGLIFKQISIKKFAKQLIFVMSILLIIISFLPEDNVQLDPIKDAINRVVGTEVFEIKRVNMKSDTYDIRNDLWIYCMTQLFPNHPILGIGLGNYSQYASKGPMSIRDIGETESSLLAVITEGGIAYFTILSFFFFKTLILLWHKLKRHKDYYDYIGFCFFCSYLVMMIGNDFLDSLFWIQSGILIGIVFGIRDKRSNLRAINI